MCPGVVAWLDVCTPANLPPLIEKLVTGIAVTAFKVTALGFMLGHNDQLIVHNGNNRFSKI